MRWGFAKQHEQNPAANDPQLPCKCADEPMVPGLAIASATPKMTIHVRYG
jgi:hypothetical protein